jgi:formylmethanofuran dehydrogenase subunit E
MPDLQKLLAQSSARHSHLCPRQVLGVRLGVAGPALVGLDAPRTDKALVVIIETDGCFADGMEAAAGVSVGHRTMRVEDYGKIAATFINVRTGQAVRLAPHIQVRQRALAYAAGETRHYFAQLRGYQAMPDTELFTVTPVALSTPIDQIVSRPGVRTTCAGCGEEIINEREIISAGLAYCRSCLGTGYYQPIVETNLQLSGAAEFHPGRFAPPTVKAVLALHEV